MKLPSRIAAVSTVLALSIGSDQAAKHIARVLLHDRFPVSLLHDCVRFQYAENPGIMLSIGAALSPAARFWIFVVALGLLLISMLVYVLLSKELDRMQTVAWSLIVSGGLGNLVDRLTRNGVVIDYVSIGVGIVRTAVFNIADVLVFAGVFLLLVHGTRKDGGPGHGDVKDTGRQEPDVRQDPSP